MKANLGVCCDYAMVDQKGKLSVIGIFNNINSSSFPARHPKMFLVYLLEGSTSEKGILEGQLLLKDPSGNILIQMNGLQFKFEGGNNGLPINSNFIIELNDQIFPKPGKYQFELIISKAKLSCKLNFFITEIPKH